MSMRVDSNAKAGVRQTDTRPGVVRRCAQDVLKRAPRAEDGVAIERVEVGLSLDKGAKRRELRVARCIRIVPHSSFDGSCEPIAAVGDRFDVSRAVAAAAECLPQPGDGLVETVAGDRRVAPRGVGERVL
jgi:hypothetical protein